MTIQEFSNTFDTLLNSYNTPSQFGEQASKRERLYLMNMRSQYY